VSTDGDADPRFERDPLRHRLGRLLVLFVPPVAVVGALLGVATVAPSAGFVLLLVVSSVAGLGVTAFKGGSLSTGSLEGSHEMGMDLDRSGVGGTAPKATFLTAFFYGLAGLGFLAMLFTGLFLV
jgi:hypothetical protein